MAKGNPKIIAIISFLWLAAATAIAAYAMYAIRQYSLPVSGAVGALTLILPAVAGLSLGSVYDLQTTEGNITLQTRKRASSRYQPIIALALLILETVLATLAGTRLANGDELDCGLNQKWMQLFRAKDSSTIRRIQDAFDCCGFNSNVDRAWPFPSGQPGGGKGVKQCVERYNRTRACHQPLKGQEQLVGGLLLLTVFLVFAWKASILLAPFSRSAWLRRLVGGQTGHERATVADGHRTIDYIGEAERYHDVEEGESATGGQGALENGRTTGLIGPLDTDLQSSAMQDEAGRWSRTD